MAAAGRAAVAEHGKALAQRLFEIAKDASSRDGLVEAGCHLTLIGLLHAGAASIAVGVRAKFGSQSFGRPFELKSQQPLISPCACACTTFLNFDIQYSSSS